jgi:hypothetical protein
VGGGGGGGGYLGGGGGGGGVAEAGVQISNLAGESTDASGNERTPNLKFERPTPVSLEFPPSSRHNFLSYQFLESWTISGVPGRGEI